MFRSPAGVHFDVQATFREHRRRRQLPLRPHDPDDD